MKLYTDEMPKSCNECPCESDLICNISFQSTCHEHLNNLRAKNCPLHHISEVQNEKAIKCLEKVKNYVCGNFISQSDYNALEMAINTLIVELKGE